MDKYLADLILDHHLQHNDLVSHLLPCLNRWWGISAAALTRREIMLNGQLTTQSQYPHSHQHHFEIQLNIVNLMDSQLLLLPLPHLRSLELDQPYRVVSMAWASIVSLMSQQPPTPTTEQLVASQSAHRHPVNIVQNHQEASLQSLELWISLIYLLVILLAVVAVEDHHQCLPAVLTVVGTYNKQGQGRGRGLHQLPPPLPQVVAAAVASHAPDTLLPQVEVEEAVSTLKLALPSSMNKSTTSTRRMMIMWRWGVIGLLHYRFQAHHQQQHTVLTRILLTAATAWTNWIEKSQE
jgi:hypothetical protein